MKSIIPAVVIVLAALLAPIGGCSDGTISIGRDEPTEAKGDGYDAGTRDPLDSGGGRQVSLDCPCDVCAWSCDEAGDTCFSVCRESN